MANSNDRFVKTYSQGGFISNLMEVWVDKRTGVNYLYAATGQAAGLTVLLDREGKPVITPVSSENDE
ncbi:MAG: xylan 1,4-beta-xylosidase [Oscillospiraceae bacterium]|nr:xylan 1,4-beta-xylosidase [Oscillospiraceae bacterium]